MKSPSVTWSWLAFLVATTAAFVACGEATHGDSPSGGASGSAGKGSANGVAGTSVASGGSSGNGGAEGDPTCARAECGPALGIVNTTCADGSTAGPTGRCLRLETGGCGWEVRNCPPAGEGGASTVGGAAAAGGTTASAGDGGAPATDRCGGCDYTVAPQQICAYQVGGPGPGRFVCATTKPCRAAGACACIVDQGTCQFMSASGGPGYCACDNGLE